MIDDALPKPSVAAAKPQVYKAANSVDILVPEKRVHPFHHGSRAKIYESNATCVLFWRAQALGGL
jgi:hypothetical protein